jgi:hypothetical protein
MDRRRVLYLGERVALTLAGLAILTNALTWLNIALMPVAFFCFLLVFPLFGTGLIAYLVEIGPPPRGRGWLVRDNQRATEMWKRILDGLSRPQMIAAGLFVAYVFVNFFGTVALMSDRRNETMDPALQVRLMTGHAAIFLLVAAGLLRAARRMMARNG